MVSLSRIDGTMLVKFKPNREMKHWLKMWFECRSAWISPVLRCNKAKLGCVLIPSGQCRVYARWQISIQWLLITLKTFEQKYSEKRVEKRTTNNRHSFTFVFIRNLYIEYGDAFKFGGECYSKNFSFFFALIRVIGQKQVAHVKSMVKSNNFCCIFLVYYG